MPRTTRIVLPGAPLHVMQRGNNRGILFHDRSEHALYLSLLREASTNTGCPVHAYVLMTNHVHLLTSPPDAKSIATMMRWLGSSFAGYINRRHGRTGTLFEGRYKSTPIGTARYFFTCHLYIEQNPVRAGMVEDPSQYAWSSYHRNALGRTDTLVTSHPMYAALGVSDDERRKEYRSLFASALDPATIDAIRHATSRGAVPGGTIMKELVDGVPRLLHRGASADGDRRDERPWLM